MAIYHFSIKNIGRSNGRSAVAAAAYRSGEKLVDSVYGKEQDYTRKTGVEFDILPDLKDGDSSCETLMSERKNIQCGIYIPIMERTALHALPFSYS